jgi:putative FmdB family regulatory protein
MAMYTYKCPLCQAQQTISHPITDDPVYKCDNCKVDLIKVFSAPPITFKGGGWGHQA